MQDHSCNMYSVLCSVSHNKAFPEGCYHNEDINSDKIDFELLNELTKMSELSTVAKGTVICFNTSINDIKERVHAEVFNKSHGGEVYEDISEINVSDSGEAEEVEMNGAKRT